MGAVEEPPSAEVIQLRNCRAELDDIAAQLDKVRAQQAALEEKADNLLGQQRAARKRRRDAVLAADAAKIPRLRIAKEVGMQRSNVYKLLESDDA